MSIPGQQSINIGLPNESANSDSLYTAFTKTQQNFTTLFTNSSPFNTFNAGAGISVDANANASAVTITNTGVTNIIAGTNIVVNQSNGNVTISATSGGNGGGTVTSVGLAPVSASRLTVSGSPIVSSGTMNIDLATSGVTAGTYSNPNVTVDAYGRITSASNGSIAGTVTSVGLTPGAGIQISGGPITSNGNISVINTGVVRLNAGTGITLSSGNGNVTISANTSSGTVTAVAVNSSQLVVTGSPIVTSGTIGINLPNTANFSGNVNANKINSNGGIINGNLIVTGNISPAAANKVGGIKPGPGVDISLDGELTIDTANLPLSFGNFTANNNVLSIVNVDENMILETEGNAEIQLVGNIGFYKPDGLPPNVANRYFQASSDGQISMYIPAADPTAGAVKIIGSTSGNFSPPVNTGVMLHITGQANIPSRLYSDGIGSFAAFVGRRINGSVSSPTAVQAGDELIRISSTGYNGTTVSGNGSARIVFQAMENFTTSNSGSNLSFWTAAIGSNTLTKIATIDNANGFVATKVVSTGNANVGNLGTAQVLATANVIAPQLISNVATGTAPLVVTSTTQVANLNVATAGTAGTVTTAAQPNITSVGTLTSVTTSGNVTANGAYRYNVATNNATVTQLTDKSTTVTCNGRTGQITTSNSSLAKGAAVTFTVNNTAVTSVTDVPIVAIQSGATANSYAICATRVQVGSFNITITNNGAGALTDTLVINFALLNVG